MKNYTLYFIALVCISMCSCSSNKDDEPIIEEEVLKFSISGAILGDEVVDITIDNGLTTVKTSTDGKFKFEHLEAGTYTITPSQDGLSFLPLSAEVEIIAKDLTDINFESQSASALLFMDHVWTPFKEDVYDIVSLNEQELKIELTSNAIWYQNGQAGLIYKLVEGDFTISALVTANKASNGEVLDCNVCLGGLMARNPNITSGENYVHIVTGFTPVGIGVETKNTTNGTSDYTPVNDGSATYNLQIKRVGSTFIMSKKAVGADNWDVAATYERTDLPSKLQIGMNIYTSLNGAEVADLSVLFQELILE